MSRINKYATFSICLFLLAMQLRSQEFPVPQFTHYNMASGLSNNIVNSITEDKSGFVWMGTSNGLNRFDGYRFKQFFHDEEDSNSLIDNTVLSILCDSKGNLWIATANGVSCYIPGQSRFKNYSASELGETAQNRFYEDADGVVWITPSRNFIWKVMPDLRLKKIMLPATTATPAVYKTQGYKSMLKDNTGRDWAWNGSYLFMLDKITKAPVRVFDLSPELDNKAINFFRQDGRGVFWIGTWGRGIARFDPQTGKAQYIRALPDDIYSNLVEWKQGSRSWLIVLQTFSAVYRMDTSGKSAKKISGDPNQPFPLTGDVFNETMVDHLGGLWVCSNNGVSYSGTSGKLFDIVSVQPPDESVSANGRKFPVFSFFEDEHSIWLSERGKCTFETDPDLGIRNAYSSLWPLSSSVYNWKLQAFYFWEKENDLYITTDSGLVIYHKINKTTSLYCPGNGSLPDLRTIIPLNNEELLIRSFSSGALIFNTALKKFTEHIYVYDSCRECQPQLVNYLFKASDNTIYCTGSKFPALQRFNQTNHRFEPFLLKGPMAGNLPFIQLFGMDEDPSGKLWITSSNGVFVIDPVKAIVTAHYSANGKMGSQFRICFDKLGNAWSTGTSGVWACLTQTNKWINFSVHDGLPGNDFENLILRQRNGHIMAGLEGALALFYPEKLGQAADNIPVSLTEARVDDQTIPLLLQPGEEKKQLTLQPGQTSFSVDFAIPDYTNIRSIQYLYQLSPLMKEPVANENGHINFNGLRPGKYLLRVTGSDKAGNLYKNDDVLVITVLPYWYQTKLFFILCSLFALLIASLLIWRRTHFIRRQARLKQQIAETEMAALRAQMNPHFIFNSLSGIENFIMKNEKVLASEYLNKFAKLIRTILDSSRNEFIPVPKDMEALQWYVDLEQLRFRNKFTCETEVDPELNTGGYRVPALLIQPYVENAILHGFAGSPAKDLRLRIRVKLENEFIHYSITDNGVGRQKAMELKNLNKPNHKSIGLKLTEERIRNLNRQRNAEGSIAITDLLDANGNPAGTQVDIIIKAS